MGREDDEDEDGAMEESTAADAADGDKEEEKEEKEEKEEEEDPAKAEAAAAAAQAAEWVASLNAPEVAAEEAEVLDEEDAALDDSFGSDGGPLAAVALGPAARRYAASAPSSPDRVGGAVSARVAEEEAALRIQQAARAHRARVELSSRQAAAAAARAEAESYVVAGDIPAEQAATLRQEDDVLSDSFASGADEEGSAVPEVAVDALEAVVEKLHMAVEVNQHAAEAQAAAQAAREAAEAEAAKEAAVAAAEAAAAAEAEATKEAEAEAAAAAAAEAEAEAEAPVEISDAAEAAEEAAFPALARASTIKRSESRHVGDAGDEEDGLDLVLGDDGSDDGRGVFDDGRPRSPAPRDTTVATASEPDYEDEFEEDVEEEVVEEEVVEEADEADAAAVAPVAVVAAVAAAAAGAAAVAAAIAVTAVAAEPADDEEVEEVEEDEVEEVEAEDVTGSLHTSDYDAVDRARQPPHLAAATAAAP